MLFYISRGHLLWAILKETNGDIDEKELAMALLNGLQRQYKIIITRLDALKNDSDFFTLETVKCRPLQEEERQKLCKPASAETAFLGSAPK